MNLLDLIRASSQPYFTRLHEVTVADKIFILRSLDFDMQAQTEANWCWAATSTSVSHFYWPRSTWTQCRVANAELSLTNCCQSPAPGPCDVPWYLDRALTRTRNYVSISGPITFSQVRAEINAGRVVGARIGWDGGGGHFMVIYGYARVGGTDYFDIDDPIYGKSHLTVADFSTNYQGTGTWTHAYITQPFRPFMIIEPLLLDHELLRRIWDRRPLLEIKAGVPAVAGRAAESRSLGLAHRIYALGLKELASDDATPARVGVRVLELEKETPRAFFDLSREDDAEVQQMSATSPYLHLFPRALEAAGSIQAGERPFELRLLRVPALNFEALWLHKEGDEEDRVIPLRGFHGLPAMHPLSYREAIERLRAPARAVAQQDDTMGA